MYRFSENNIIELLKYGFIDFLETNNSELSKSGGIHFLKTSNLELSKSRFIDFLGNYYFLNFRNLGLYICWKTNNLELSNSGFRVTVPTVPTDR